MNNSTYYNGAIGIDGGGSTCRIVVEIENKRDQVITGAANVSSDFSTAIDTITGGLQSAAEASGITLKQLYKLPAYAGLAGVTSPLLAEDVRLALPLERVIVSDDRISNLTGALGMDDGSVAAIGTGSCMIARIDGKLRALGGHGPALGDEASAAWLGRKILSRCLHVLDGLATASPLSTSILEEFESSSSMIAFAQNASPQAFGRFAPRVVTAAKQGDSNACQLMRDGAQYIEQSLLALSWHPALPLCLTGGVGMHYREFLSVATAAAIVKPQGSALDGALSLAKQHREKTQASIL